MNYLSLSPLDSRYAEKIEPLTHYFSEFALMRYRVLVEVEYLIALSTEPKISELPKFSADSQKKLRALYEKFDTNSIQQIKAIEKTTNHDVKAVEYFLAEKMKKIGLGKFVNFIHFALTSEDVNNLAYALMLRDGINEAIFPSLKNLQKEIFSRAKKWATTPLLARTHGQSATPTTFGKEFAVFASRLNRQFDQLKNKNF